jgi:hypothetical protein
MKELLDWATDGAGPAIYWISGLAGTGKTTIAYSICEELAHQGRLGASYFCSRQWEDTRQAEYMIPSVVDQLAWSSTAFARAITTVNQSASSGMHLRMREMLLDRWKDSTRDRCKPILPLVVVIDALDENMGGISFVQELLIAYVKTPIPGLKFLITCRPHDTVTSAFKEFQSVSVAHELHTYDKRDEVQQDIRTYLTAELYADSLPETSLLETLATQSGELFIYAATLVRMCVGLSASEKHERLQDFLEDSYSSPIGTLSTDVLYRYIIRDAFSRSIPEGVLLKRLDILRAILSTEVAMPCSAIAELLCFDEDDVMKVVKSLYPVIYLSQDSTVWWFHTSFPESVFHPARFDYLFNGIISMFSQDSVADDFDPLYTFLEESEEHACLANHCFRILESCLYFNISNHPSASMFDTDVDHVKNDRLVTDTGMTLGLLYSVNFWVHHLDKSSERLKKTLFNRVWSFLDTTFLFWIEVINMQNHSQRGGVLVLQASRNLRAIQDIALKVGIITKLIETCS